MKKLILLMFCMIFLIGNVSSSWEWDNVKSYDKEAKTITIKNAIGLGEDIATIKLESAQNVYVMRGSNRKVAEFTINNYENYDKVLNKMEFYDIKNSMEKFDRGFTYKYKKSLGFFDVDVYENVCEKEAISRTNLVSCNQEFVETRQEEKFEWVVLENSKGLPKGEITIGVFTNVYAEDHVEWIPTFFGVKIGEWAEWTDALTVGLVSYWALNDTSGDAIDSRGGNDLDTITASQGETGKIGTAYEFDGVNEYVNDSSTSGLPFQDGVNSSFTINTWVYWLGQGRHIGGWTDTSDANHVDMWASAAGNWYLYTDLGTDVNSGISVSQDVWEMGTITYNHLTNNATVSINGTLVYSTSVAFSGNMGEAFAMGTRYEGGDFDWNGTIDEYSIWNRSLSIAEITQLWNSGDGITFLNPVPPTPSIISPINALNSTSRDINFLCNATDDIGLKNITLYINETANYTNATGYYEFDGVNDYINFGDVLDSITNDTASTSAWFRTDGVPAAFASAQMLSKDNVGASRAYLLDMGSSGVINALWWQNCGGGAPFSIATTPLTYDDGEWHHAVGVLDSGTAKIYIDGDLKATSGTTITGICNSTASLRIGSTTGGGANARRFNGSIDEVRIYNSSLDATDVTNLYNQGRIEGAGSVDITNLISYWDLGSNGAEDVINTNDGTNVGAVPLIFLNTTQALADGFYNWSCGAYDSDDQGINATARNLTIDTTPFIQFETPTPVDDFNTTLNTFIANVSLTETYFENLTHYLYNVTGVLIDSETFTNSTRDINWSSLADGTYSYNATVWTTTLQQNSTETRNITIDFSKPLINISSPLNGTNYDYLLSGNNITLNVTTTDPNLDVCLYQYNSTNTTFSCTTAVLSEVNLTFTNQTNIWIFANDTLGNLNRSQSNWSFTVFDFNNYTYSNNTTEVSSTTILGDFQTGLAISSAFLNYNNTNYSATVITLSDNIYRLTREVVAPAVSDDTNITWFFWINGVNTTEHNQTVLDIDVDDCSINSVVLYNFTMVDEKTQEELNETGNNTQGLVDLQIYAFGTANLVVQFNKTYSQINPFAICLNNSLSGGEQYNVSALIEYDANTYEKELYHIQNERVNSSTLAQNITLFDLNSSTSQVFKLIAKDSSFLSLPDALVEIQRKYINEGVFKIVEIPKTDSNGETIAHLVLDDVIYNFIVKKDGVVISSFNNVKAVCQTPLVTTCSIDFNSFASTIEVPDYETLEDFSFTLGYDSSTRTVSSQFEIPSGDTATILLNVTRQDALGTDICTDSLNLTSGTLSCVVPNNFGNATVIAKLYRDGGLQAQGEIKIGQNPSDIYGGVLVMLALFIMLSLIGAGISSNPIVTVIFLMVGVIILFALNLVANNGFIGATATILWLLIVVILVIIKGAKRN